jgi:UDP-N-acetylmuramyl pentapeptide phosphotransferase/UDP-N-acetylglucosamine-1-phosphate transferase
MILLRVIYEKLNCFDCSAYTLYQLYKILYWYKFQKFLLLSIYFLIIIAISALISLVLTPITRNFFVNRGWVENPHEKNKKTGNATAISTVPRGGGIPIFLAVAISSLIFLPPDKHLVGILVAAFFTLLIGFWDFSFRIL